MPVSNDNQDFGASDDKNKTNVTEKKPEGDDGTFSSDDLKGKKIDADLEQEKDKPVEEK